MSCLLTLLKLCAVADPARVVAGRARARLRARLATGWRAGRRRCRRCRRPARSRRVHFCIGVHFCIVEPWQALPAGARRRSDLVGRTRRLRCMSTRRQSLSRRAASRRWCVHFCIAHGLGEVDDDFITLHDELCAGTARDPRHVLEPTSPEAPWHRRSAIRRTASRGLGRGAARRVAHHRSFPASLRDMVN